MNVYHKWNSKECGIFGQTSASKSAAVVPVPPGCKYVAKDDEAEQSPEFFLQTNVFHEEP
jgi:hypothetical protein